jgi:hypothetical protein
MTFFNKKTEVMQIEMTPYGRYLYSIGKFKPHSYEFVDDDILYRNAGSQESTEGQGTAHKRIMEETPKLKINRAFQDEAPQLESPSNIQAQRIMQKRMNQTQNSLFALGKSSYSSENAPTFQVSTIQGSISSSFNHFRTNSIRDGAKAGDLGADILIPQININYEIHATLRNELEESSFLYSDASEVFSDGTYVTLHHQEIVMHLKEFNSFYEKENFEIEVFLEQSEDCLKPLKFTKEFKSLVNDLLVEDVEGQKDFYISTDPLTGKHEDYSKEYVNYYFSIEKDSEIPAEDLCKAINKLEVNNQFIDEELICPDRRSDRFDIYASRVDPSDLEDCDD